MTVPGFEHLVKVMRRTFGVRQVAIDRETTSGEVPGWDSLSHVMLMIEISNEFGVMLPADETAGLRNVGELYDLLVERLGKSG